MWHLALPSVSSRGLTDGDDEERDGQGADGGAVGLGGGLQEGEGADAGARGRRSPREVPLSPGPRRWRSSLIPSQPHAPPADNDTQ